MMQEKKASTLNTSLLFLIRHNGTASTAVAAYNARVSSGWAHYVFLRTNGADGLDGGYTSATAAG